MRDISRRRFLQTTGAVGIGSMLSFSGVASADTPTTLVDDAFEKANDTPQEALIVFDSNDAVDQLSTLSLSNDFHKFEVLPIGYTELSGTRLTDVANLDSVQRIERNTKLEYYNDDTRELLRTDEVQSGTGTSLDTAYSGESAHTAVIDTGVDGDHPDLENSIENHYEWAGNPVGSSPLWVDVGPVDTDDSGHGTHTSGTIVGDGTESDGQFKGHAPDASLTMYAADLVLTLIKPVAAYDHLLANHGDEVQVVSNSYGLSSENDFDPMLSLNVATWEAYNAGLLSVFSAGNSGPSTNTLNDYAKAPHVLGVAATNDSKSVTEFSSRGRASDYSGGGEGANYDREAALSNLRKYYGGRLPSGPLGLYRIGVGAPGNEIVSTMTPNDPLQEGSADDGRPYYATISGTSMSCPATAGIATLVVDAYQQNNGSEPTPIDVLNTIEATSKKPRDSYTQANMGAGFPDGYAAVVRAEAGDLDSTSEDT